MACPKKTLLSWSSGKDCAWALHRLNQNPSFEVVGLLTTLNRDAGRVAMHGVRRELLELQARHAGLPLQEVELPWPCPNAEYERIMAAACASVVTTGVQAVAFGDLFLEEIRAYRIRQLEGTGLEPVFPVWGVPTAQLAREMVDAGVRAIVTCVDSRQLDATFSGRIFDHEFLDTLPPGVDPCGENGEFHTFVYASPVFPRGPIPVRVGETVDRDGFIFTDVLPA